jgi:PAS domain S-box-containing protein
LRYLVEVERPAKKGSGTTPAAAGRPADLTNQDDDTPGASSIDDRLELFFSQSLDGFFFMMLDEPIRWDETVEKEAALDYVFEHQRVTKVNDAMLAQYGVTREQFLGRRPRDFFEHDIPYGRRVWRDFFDRGRLHIETDERRFDGTPIAIEGDYICFFDAEGRITGHFGIQRDVTERRRVRELLEERVAVRTAALARSENRLSAVISALPDQVFVIDEAGRYIDILSSRSAVSDSGNPIRTVHDVFPPEVAAPLLQAVKQTLEVRETRVFEQLRDGRSFEGRTSLLNTDIDGKRGVVVIARDVTDKKRVEALESQNVYLQEEIKVERSFGEIVGSTAAMRQVFKSIEKVAATDATVLILGETGTGKELIARAIHNLGKRRQAVMVKVNCGAVPATLAESELFGHERGAFTGAVNLKKGRFELAHHGTIFLDEVGELPAEVQVKLLRALQEQEIERVGATQTTKVDVRVLAATNRDLQEDVKKGTFRADLFYRLNIFPIRVPPLRERKEDIPSLAHHFVAECSRRIGKPIRHIGTKAVERLCAYDWPGNIRELANVLERAVILSEGQTILESHLALLGQSASGIEAFLTLEEMERQHIKRALEQTGGVLAGPQGAARLLGMSRSTVWSRMRKLGIN